jgi:hypothetical protein
MKKPIDLWSLTLGLILGGVIAATVAAATSAGNRTSLEYKVVPGSVFSNEQNPLEKGINNAVTNGWEFVSASHLNDHWAFAVLRREKK